MGFTSQGSGRWNACIAVLLMLSVCAGRPVAADRIVNESEGAVFLNRILTLGREDALAADNLRSAEFGAVDISAAAGAFATAGALLSATVDAQGRPLAPVSIATLYNSLVTNNVAVARAGKSQAGSAAGVGRVSETHAAARSYSEAVVTGGAVYSGWNGSSLLNSVLLENKACAYGGIALAGKAAAATTGAAVLAMDSGATADAHARADAMGGALRALGNGGAFSSSRFDANGAVAFGGEARGGEARGGGIVRTVNGNESLSVAAEAGAFAGANAGGGALSLAGEGFSLTGSVYNANTAGAFGGTAEGGNAVGGNGTLAFDASAVFALGEIIATAHAGAAAFAEAFGGAIAAEGRAAELAGNEFSANGVIAEGGIAVGGAASGGSGVMAGTRDNTSVVNASASASTYAWAKASGGAAHFRSEAVSIRGNTWHGNLVRATGGDARAGQADGGSGSADAPIDYQVEAEAVADAHGRGAGGAFRTEGDGTLVLFNIFADNGVHAAGGNARAGTAATMFHSTPGWEESETDASADAGAEAGGGAVSLEGGSSRIEGNLFYRNSGNAFGGDATGGTAISPNAASIVTAVGRADAVARGGALVMVGDNNAAKGSRFMENTVSAHGGFSQGGGAECQGAPDCSADATASASAEAFGGAMYVSGGQSLLENNYFAGNQAIAQGGFAQGGAADGNLAFAGSEARAFAGGGAVFLLGENGILNNNVFRDNRVSAVGGIAFGGDAVSANLASGYAEAAGMAKGGAILAQNSENFRIESSGFYGNAAFAQGGDASPGTAQAPTAVTWSNGDAYAFGGAVTVEAGADAEPGSAVVVEIRNSAFIHNAAVATAGTSPTGKTLALGGAVFVGAAYVDSAALTLAANAGNDVFFYGNSVSDQNGRRANAIHFGGSVLNAATGYFADCGAATLDIVADGTVRLYDPVSAELYSLADPDAASFALTATGAGEFRWGGANVLDASGGSVIRLSGASTVFRKDFSVAATSDKFYRTGGPDDAYAETGGSNSLSVTFADGDFRFDVNRDRNAALFDFAGSSSAGALGNLVVQGGRVGMHPGRQLLYDLAGEYVISQGLDAAEAADAAAYFNANRIHDNLGSLQFRSDPTRVLAAVDYRNPYRSAIMAANRNAVNASVALNSLVDDELAITDAQFDAIAGHFRGVTPEYAASQVVSDFAVAKNINTFVSRILADRGAAACAASDSAAAAWGNGFWSGYGGTIARRASEDFSEGFARRTHDIMLGYKRDWNDALATSIHGGYVRGTVDFTRIDAETTSDAFFLGVAGRWSLPFSPGTTITAAASAGQSRNKGWRALDDFRERGRFRDTLYAANVTFAHSFDRNGYKLVPLFGVDFGRVKQNPFTETGTSGTSTRMWGIRADAFSSTLGLAIKRELTAGEFTLTPRLAAEWSHNFGERRFRADAAYINTAAPILFHVESARLPRNSAQITTALTGERHLADGNRLSCSIEYEGGVARKEWFHSFSISAGIYF